MPSLLADYIAERELAKQLQVSLSTVRKWRQENKGPPWMHIGQPVYYPTKGVTRWLKRNERHAGKIKS